MKGMRFDIVRLDRNHLGELYDNDKVQYGALKDRMKQALPTIAEVRAKADGTHDVFESSALPAYAFTNGDVQKVKTYMTEMDDDGTGTRKNPLQMGFTFFQHMFNALKVGAVLELPDLPPVFGRVMGR